MLYNIRIELLDGGVMKFQRRSSIKPINCVKLNEKIAKEIFPQEWKEITSTPVY